MVLLQLGILLLSVAFPIVGESDSNVDPKAGEQPKPDVKYSVEYDPSSPVKTIPLKEITLKLDLYQFSKPAGFVEVKTDQNQSFTLKEAYSLEVTSIQDQDKYKAMCSGYATEVEPKIIITCDLKK
jgi:hypothetical protein